ncbi:MAG: hypothetical protein UY50_C0019G0006 [Parcubacteria group bacterium GW2011_GWA2_49_9]|nr:MAG: hypothetical protein UY50_C0019G0006 [Parcubacteria group bacterium GW2011_GWA2_49_9]
MAQTKRLLFLQLILAVLILLLAFLNNLASSKINDFNKAQIITGNFLNNKLLWQIFNQVESTKLETYAMLGTPPVDIAFSFSSGHETALQLKLNQIEGCNSVVRQDRIECTNKSLALIREGQRQQDNEYYALITVANATLQKGTVWSAWQNVFTIFQIISALCSIFIGYIISKKESK